MVAGACTLIGPYWAASDMCTALTAGKKKNTDKHLPFQGANGAMYVIQIEGA